MSENLLDQLGFFKLKAMVGTALSAARVMFASRVDPPLDSPVLIGNSWDDPAGEATICIALIADALNRYIDRRDITAIVCYGLAAERPQSPEYRTFTSCSLERKFAPRSRNAGNPGQVLENGCPKNHSRRSLVKKQVTRSTRNRQ